MQTYPGTSIVVVSGLQTLGSAGGRAISLPAGPASALISVRVSFVTTATAGNRVLALQAKDAAANILFEIPISANVAASLTTIITWAAGAPNFSSGTRQVANIPVGLVLPAGSSIQIFDTANIDVADTIATNIATAV